MSLSSTRGIFEAVVLTGFASHDGDHEAVNDAVLVEELALLEPRFADLEDRFELAVKTRAQLEQHGIEDALEPICATIDPADRDLAFRLCVRVMLADGKTEAAEAMVLGTLQELFALSSGAVQKHLEEERAKK